MKKYRDSTVKSNYRNGSLHGEQLTYDLEGNLIGLQYYENDKITKHPAYKNLGAEEKMHLAKKSVGSKWWVAVQFNYLMTKYQESCIFLPYDLSQGIDYLDEKDRISLRWYCLDEKNSLEFPEHDEQLYVTRLRECIEKSTRLTIIPLSMYVGNSGHSNIIVYDKIQNTVERYDPSGHTSKKYNPKKLDNVLHDFFSFLTEKDVRYFPPPNYCPKIGPQQIAKESKERSGSFFDKGMCTVWSFIYADMRLKFPDRGRTSVATLVTEGISNKTDPYTFARKITLLIYELSEKIKEAKTKEEILSALNEATKNLSWGLKNIEDEFTD